MYEQCIQMLPGIEPSKVLAIGDQMATDVVGARRFGFHTAIVMTGAGEVAFQHAKSAEDAIKIATSFSLVAPPNWVLSSLRWRSDERMPYPFRRAGTLSGLSAAQKKSDGLET